MKRPPLTDSTNGTTPRPVFKGGVLYVEGAAEMLATTQKAIRAKVASNRLPFHRLDGRVIFFREELEQFLDALPGIGVDEALKNLTRRTNGMVAQ